MTLECRVPADVLRRQYAECLRRGYPRLKHHLRAPTTRPAAIVARGPSALDHFRAIPADADIFAVKTGLALRTAGHQPKYTVHVDPGPGEARHVMDVSARALVSSQCHPTVFNALPRGRTTVFSARIDKLWAPPAPVSAGTNVAAHALYLAVLLGYRDIHLIGCDCDLGDGIAYYHDGGVVPDDAVSVRAYNGRSYITTPVLQGFADEISHTARLLLLLKGARVHVHGGSLLALTASIPRETRYLDDTSALCWLPYSDRKSKRVIFPVD